MMSTGSEQPKYSPPTASHSWLFAIGLLVIFGLGVFATSRWLAPDGAAAADKQPEPKAPAKKADDDRRMRAPELTGGAGWLNTAGPLRLKDLRGKVVLLDFWTYCCINCIHTLPDLHQLEKKYANQLVVIGVHSAKFDNEKTTENIRKAILRYEIAHPVVNDAEMIIWRKYRVSSWPSLYLIDPEGYLYGYAPGEGNREVLEEHIDKLIKLHRKKKTLDEKPRRFELARASEKGDSPLFFPGKVLADAASNRLFIADSTHHRIVVTTLDGRKIAIAGSGEPGLADGAFAKAQFDDPQGLALSGEKLYVADRRNHVIRALDLKARTVTTIAGTGKQDRSARTRTGKALKIGMNSPWDLCLKGDTLYVAQAGHHQIWTLDLDKRVLSPYAGSGRENIRDGPLDEAWFAQPSGLTTDGTYLYVADSEVSAIRQVPLLNGRGDVKTIVGEGLFDFGDVDGVGDTVRLQHALGVAYYKGRLYVADTYNSKIKILDPVKRSCQTFLGAAGGWLGRSLFNEPGGLSFAGDKLYVADTNGHRIRVVDMKTKAVSTLVLKGVEAPKIRE
jgi:thiol-disulfide isomerase/thioredoxin/sugar lactone lactonase YvrE